MRDVRDERETLAEENARLRDELATSQSATPSYAEDTAYPEDTAGHEPQELRAVQRTADGAGDPERGGLR